MVSFLKLRRQCGVSHEVRQGVQGASLMAPGKSGLHVRGEGVRDISTEPWKQIRASRHVEVGLSRSFSHCLSMGFSRQEYWRGLPFPSTGDLPNRGIKARSPALQADC